MIDNDQEKIIVKNLERIIIECIDAPVGDPSYNEYKAAGIALNILRSIGIDINKKFKDYVDTLCNVDGHDFLNDNTTYGE